MTEIQIRRMELNDITTALELCGEAGWNQTSEDWQRLMTHEPRGCFVAISSGRLVGTITTTTYGDALGWIGMMLVTSSFRRKGIATQLMRRGIEYIQGKGIVCIRLDATPMGECVYRRLGFEPEAKFQRWHRTETPSSSDQTPNGVELSEQHLMLDRQAFGCERSVYLSQLLKHSQLVTLPRAFGMSRPGIGGTYIGPVIASHAEDAEAIVRSLLNTSASDAYWDIPSVNIAGQTIAEKLGFAPVRDLTRMRFGPDTATPNLTLQYAIADPGTG